MLRKVLQVQIILQAVKELAEAEAADAEEIVLARVPETAKIVVLVVTDVQIVAVVALPGVQEDVALLASHQQKVHVQAVVMVRVPGDAAQHAKQVVAVAALELHIQQVVDAVAHAPVAPEVAEVLVVEGATGVVVVAVLAVGLVQVVQDARQVVTQRVQEIVMEHATLTVMEGVIQTATQYAQQLA